MKEPEEIKMHFFKPKRNSNYQRVDFIKKKWNGMEIKLLREIDNLCNLSSIRANFFSLPVHLDFPLSILLFFFFSIFNTNTPGKSESFKRHETKEH